MRRLYCLALLSCCAASPALAQSDPPLPSPEEVANKDMVTIAVGGAYLPDYVGSDDYRLIPAGAIRGKVNGFSFSTRGAYFYFDAVPHRGASSVELDFGPIAGVRMNRTGHVDDDIVNLLPDRKTAIELGGFAGVSFHRLTNPYDTLALRLDVLHDVANAHESTTFSPNVDFSTPLSRTTYASASLGAEFVSNRFADYYYSISPADSLATGLPIFNADGGLKDWRLSLLLNQSITGDLLHGFSVFGAGQYSRLVGDFKRSPIVSQRGTPNQWIAAAGLAYTW